MVEGRLRECLVVVARSLHTETQGEMLAARKAIIKKIAHLMANYKPETLVLMK